MPTKKPTILKKRNKDEYNKQYKSDRRIVVYVSDAEIKNTLTEETERTGTSMSSLIEPAIKELADAIRQKRI